MARLCRQFVIRIYGTGRLGLVTFLTALGNLPSVQVADAEKPQADLTDGVDTRLSRSVPTGGMPDGTPRDNGT
ncbi:hypothetical protein PR003_g15042 [Phytophthora rubi]|uniref:Uncharacterized protein n=1 Tax=Phytophthora rubi TaxID=129364 RepID=A0A6A4F357_9STRA|nr:hypothetical protein PR002_g15021 [Phytophthora rubi]KAE9018809.1 hypothetical protein PR001_g14036 [Phytophthora rubi]KAE9331364.1 hypothetical protein PR003_g15042 [Phytophthora rubi]